MKNCACNLGQSDVVSTIGTTFRSDGRVVDGISMNCHDGTAAGELATYDRYDRSSTKSSCLD